MAHKVEVHERTLTSSHTFSKRLCATDALELHFDLVFVEHLDGLARFGRTDHKCALTLAESLRREKFSRAHAEYESVHWTYNSVLLDPPFGERGSRVIARVFDGEDFSVHIGHDDVKRRVLYADKFAWFEIGSLYARYEFSHTNSLASNLVDRTDFAETMRNNEQDLRRQTQLSSVPPLGWLSLSHPFGSQARAQQC